MDGQTADAESLRGTHSARDYPSRVCVSAIRRSFHPDSLSDGLRPCLSRESVLWRFARAAPPYWLLIVVAPLKPAAGISTDDLSNAGHVSVPADDSDDRCGRADNAGKFGTICLLHGRHASFRAHADGRSGTGWPDHVGGTGHLYHVCLHRDFLS